MSAVLASSHRFLLPSLQFSIDLALLDPICVALVLALQISPDRSLREIFRCDPSLRQRKYTDEAAVACFTQEWLLISEGKPEGLSVYRNLPLKCVTTYLQAI